MGILLDKVAVERLVAARLAKMMTQIELARASRISLRTIQQLETRGRASFSESTLIGICRTLDLPLDQILPHSTNADSSSVPSEAPPPSTLPPELKPDPESALATPDLATASQQSESVGRRRSAGDGSS